MRDETQQSAIRAASHMSAYKMFSVIRCVELLEFLWADQLEDEKVYGAHGLEMTMERHNFNICIG